MELVGMLIFLTITFIIIRRDPEFVENYANMAYPEEIEQDTNENSLVKLNKYTRYKSLTVKTVRDLCFLGLNKLIPTFYLNIGYFSHSYATHIYTSI